jgi:chemotaxis protein CheX
MTTMIALSPTLDLRAAAPLKAEILAARGQAVTLDGSAVQRLGGLCFQVLLSALKTWRDEGQSLTFINASEALVAQWSALGATVSDLGVQGETV